MNYKDVEWWVCCASIIIISYTLGTLTDIPTWSTTDTKLSIFSSMATGIAGIATFFAAIYAYKSFNSWEDRVKEQHRFEQKVLSFKELSRVHKLVYIDFWDVLQTRINANRAHKEFKENFSEGSTESEDYYSKECNISEEAASKALKQFIRTSISYETNFEDYKSTLKNNRALEIIKPNKLNEYLNACLNEIECELPKETNYTLAIKEEEERRTIRTEQKTLYNIDKASNNTI